MLQLSVDEYQVGWICALSSEYAAAKAMLDEQHQMVSGQDRADSNSYTFGRIHNHNIAIACLPAGVDGTNAAAVVATNLSRTFRSIRFGLMVGIGGGIPDLQNGIDIRLGDIVVSQPSGRDGGVVQYDKGKSHDGGQFVRKGQLNKPPATLLTALANMQAEHQIEESQIPTYLERMLANRPKMRRLNYLFPKNGVDTLHCTHVAETSISCRNCEAGIVKREPRESTDPVIHYGVIASGNQVIKSATHRNQLRDECGAICVEMEAAGLMDNFPCLVIRGICDYADSSKNDQWHNYAAATAAAFAKELLSYVSVEQTSHEQPIQEILYQIDETLKEGNRLQIETLEETRTHFRKVEAWQQTQHERNCLQVFKTSNYERFRDINPDRAAGTCRWVLDHPHFQQWHHSSHSDLLWISADPGCGKSVLSRSLVVREFAALQQSTTCYYFFKDNERQDRLAPALCAVLHQLFSHQPRLLCHAIPAWERNGDKVREEVGTMWQVLFDALADENANDVVCVFDALDECHEDDRRELVTRLCDFHDRSLKRITGRATLKFLATSRPYDTVERWFERTVSRLPQVRLRGEDENDNIRNEIDLVIDQHIENLAIEFSLSVQHQDRLRQRLQEMKHRTYLWLYLAVENVRDKYHNSPDPEEEPIDELPTSVENAYEQILQKITDSQRPQARKILLIIAGARRPLTIGEASLAFNADTAYEKDHLTIKDSNISHLENRIRDWCGLFVFINHSQLFLIHQTAKKFLVTDIVACSAGVGLWKSSLLTTQVESEMAIICITYLYLMAMEKCSLAQSSNHGDTKSEFFKYCSVYWTLHFRDHTIMNNKKLLNMVIGLYDTASEPFRAWFHIMWTHSNPFQNVPHVQDQHAIAMSGHAVVLEERYRKQAFDLNLCDDIGRTALIWAAGAGHVEVVKMLLYNGAEVHVLERGGGSALYMASKGGYETVLQILLDNGAQVNVHGRSRSNALCAAAEGGYEKVVQMLLDKGALVNAYGGLYGTALHRASAKGYEKIVQMLINAGADITAPGGRYDTPLHTAAEEGHEGVVKILVNAGADVNASGGSYGTALHRASVRGHEKVVKMLLDLGATETAV